MLRCARQAQQLRRVQCSRAFVAQAPSSSTSSLSSAYSSTAGPATAKPLPTPWFVDQDSTVKPAERTTHSLLSRASSAPPVPHDAPEVLKDLQLELLQSPHLDFSNLVVCRAISPAPGPSLPERPGQGKRKRGGTIAGESAYDSNPSGIWNWFVFAQVKEGTEGRGAVESVVRQVRKSLLTRTPSVPLPPKSRRHMGTGWALVDGGDFAVHILSKEAREKYFSDIIIPQ